MTLRNFRRALRRARQTLRLAGALADWVRSQVLSALQPREWSYRPKAAILGQHVSYNPQWLQNHQLVRANSQIIEDQLLISRATGLTLPSEPLNGPPGHFWGNRFAYVLASGQIDARTGLVFIGDRFVVPSGPPLRNARDIARRAHSLERARLSDAAGNATFISGTVFPIGHGPIRNFFHWNVDIFPRILHAQSLVNDLVVVAPDFPNFAAEALALAGIRSQTSQKICVADRIVLVDFGDPGWMHPGDAQIMKEFALTALGSDYESQATSTDRVFVSREDLVAIGKVGTRNRQVRGIGELQKELEQSGFSILSMLRSPRLIDQIRLVASASVVVGQHGAGLANILWGQEQIHLVELLSSAHQYPGQRRIAAARQDQYTAVRLPPRRDAFFGDASDAREALKILL